MRCSMFSHTKSLKSIVQIYSTALDWPHLKCSSSYLWMVAFTLNRTGLDWDNAMLPGFQRMKYYS